MNKTSHAFAASQGRRLIVGCVLGSLCAIAWHLVGRDSAFRLVIHKWWSSHGFELPFDGAQAYRPELLVLGIVLVIGILFIALSGVLRVVRAWWAGITSITTIVATLITMASLEYRVGHYRSELIAYVLILGGTIGLEHWRQRSTHRRPVVDNTELQLSTIPHQIASAVSPDRWKVGTSDEPIQEWDEDMIGRAAIVELLAEHALTLGTPVIALHGGLGDGKSSVLNLLRRALEPVAIIVSFNAWLPGNETTFAIDLFRDIAAECRKQVYVPQLRKRARVYARTISGSFSYLAGLKELLPAESQRDEIYELRRVLARVPLPIVVLLDELDRMQREELLVVLKVLRGVASIPNVTFVCAFSETALRKRLSANQDLSYEYFEKFFPVSVELSPPDPDMLGTLVQGKLKMYFKECSWFRIGEDEKKFADLFSRVWRESMALVCTNFRKAALLINDVIASAQQVKGEVNALDLVGIQCLRRFFPDAYHLVRRNSVFLTYEERAWEKKQYLFLDEQKKQDSKRFFERLEGELVKADDPAPARVLLSYLFPQYAATNKDSLSFSLSRPASIESAEKEKRICHPDYFSIYFRTAVPQDMFSNAELEKIIFDLNKSQSEAGVDAVFAAVLAELPKQHPKREDCLWKIGRTVDRLNDATAEWLAYAAARHSADYAYDLMNIGEAARALNIVFEVAQKLSSTPLAQRILLGAMTRTADDTFARRLLEYTEDRKRNKVLINFTNVDPVEVRKAFIQRMRTRYGPSVPIDAVDITRGDWWAFRWWVNNSTNDREIGQEFWRRYIDQSRKRLAQAINFIYPRGVSWEGDPTPIVDSLFPIQEARELLQSLAPANDLDEIESQGIRRLQKLLEGKWSRPMFEENDKK